MTFSRVLRLLLLFSPIWPVAAQNLVFQQLNAGHGLPASEVYHLRQDKKGYVWAFTEYGIARHNGTRFVPVCKNLPFNASVIYRVAESPKGELYVANSRGQIYQIVGDNAQRVKGLKLSPEMVTNNQVILDMIVDDSSNIWFSTCARSYKYSLITGRIQELCRNSTKNITVFKNIDGQGFVLKRTPRLTPDTCLIRVEDAHNNVIFSKLFPSLNQARNLMVHKGDNYYVMLEKELMLIRPGKSPKQMKFTHPAVNMRLAPNGHLWLSTIFGGVYELDADLHVISHYLDGVAVSDVLFDDHKGVWISTIGRGIFYARNTQRVSCDQHPGLSAGVSLLKTLNGKLFIGTFRGDLFVSDAKNNWRKIRISNDRQTSISDIIFREGSYYIGAKWALLKANADFSKITRTHDDNLSVYALATGKTGELIIASASRICIQKKGTDRIENKLFMRTPRLMSTRSDGTIFIGLESGLYVLQQSLVRPAYLAPLADKNISRLRTGSDQSTWICTKSDGVFRLTADNRLLHYLHTPAEVITDILFLSPTRAVLATNRGTFIDRLENGSFKHKIRLSDEETTCLERYGNQLYLGTKFGLTVLDVNHLLDTPVYPFYLKSVTNDGRPVSLNNLTYKNKNLLFSFDLLAYELNEKRLSYVLQGPTQGKGVVDGTQLQLQNLAPGR